MLDKIVLNVKTFEYFEKAWSICGLPPILILEQGFLVENITKTRRFSRIERINMKWISGKNQWMSGDVTHISGGISRNIRRYLTEYLGQIMDNRGILGVDPGTCEDIHDVSDTILLYVHIYILYITLYMSNSAQKPHDIAAVGGGGQIYGNLFI